MSKANPVSTSASASSLDQRKARRKVSRVRLPTPPPDPNIGCDDDCKKGGVGEREFLEYLESLQRNQPHPGLSRSISAFTPAIATEDAFDHLDKLYKLMEQMLTLREQNAALHRRIMDLERMRNLQDMHRQLDTAEKLEDVPVYDPDSLFAESFLCNILAGTKKEQKQRVPMRFRQSILRRPQQRARSDGEHAFARRVSVPVPGAGAGDKPSKVSKWTKVKAAFKWEKASPTVSDAKSQDSGLGGMQPVNYEVARYLRVPSTSEELGTSPADSGAAEISTPGSISSASSTEDIHRHVHRRTQDDTSDEEQIFSFDYIPINKDEPSTSSVNKSGKSPHRTPWAKMKNIIHTQARTSLKKKHRLSAKSDDSKIDGSVCSDNEDVFEADDNKSPILIIQTPEDISKENHVFSMEHSIPVDIIARYRVINDESNVQDRLSKWSKVKKAFLSSPSISRNESSSPVSNPEFPAIRRDVNPTKESDEKLHAEIQKNYLQLQKKLSLEFQEKLQEWERSKVNSPCTSVSSTTQVNVPQDDTKEMAFKKKMEEWEKIRGQPKHNMQLQSEENLPPEFRKKLDEWKKMKKSSMKEESKKKTEWTRFRSVSAHRADFGLENQPLSDDFIKKYESWKQIKSAGTTPTEELESRGSFKGNKSPSPRLSRKDLGTRESKRIKDQTDKELQWIEKELSKIEREKQRLERDRQKFLERDERLPKIRRSVIGGNKKEILVNTPSGLYRFEGISRKFTRKLYEWEKAQGIRPEESTFALLRSSCIPQIGSSKHLSSAPLERSKSADSVMNPDMNSCTHLSQQPSSLSLNDIGNLEKDLLLESSSVPNMIPSSENIDSEEPEAIIVEVEDVVEETASFLENFMEKHTPVYLKQENRNMCEGETRAAPTVRRSESTRAQANYNLIEDIIVTLKALTENEEDIQRIENMKLNSDSIIIINSDDDPDVKTLKAKQGQQRNLSGVLMEKLILLQEANANVASDITRDGSNFTITRLADVLETIQDLSSAIFNIAEAIDRNIYKRNKNQMESDIIHSTSQTYPQIAEHLMILNYKILDLRRNLSYICAASDMSISSWKKRPERPLLRKIPSVERKRANFRKSRSRESQEDGGKKRCSKDETDDDSDVQTLKNNSPSLSRQVEQGAIKKRIRYRQKGSQSKTLDETDDEDEEFVERKPKPRRMRSQNSTESNKSVVEREVRCEEEEVRIDPGVVEKVLVKTRSTNFLNFEESGVSEAQEGSSAVFVKTTRKLFTPIPAQDAQKTSECVRQEEIAKPLSVPASPVPVRKQYKEISPNIRLMMVKYNQKLTEESGAPKSAGSSGSASPVAWRSPVLERRVKAQTERYQQELQKMSPLLGGRREVQKSASMGVVVSGNKQVTVHRTEASPENSPKIARGILKSSSTGGIQMKKIDECQTHFKPIPETEIPLYIPTTSNTSLSTVSDSRSSRIRRAKEEFLNSPLPAKPPIFRENSQKRANRNRLSQISMASESSCASSAYDGLLVKSASAGMINVDPDVYKQFNPDIHDGFVSLPRSKKSKEGLLSNITSKFRKVKMRRYKDKDKDKMNTVSTLCRQSLVVDIQTDGSQENLSIPATSSAETSPSTSRSSSWIRKPKLFKSKQ